MNVNYRIYGDVLSQFGDGTIGQQITLKPDYPTLLPPSSGTAAEVINDGPFLTNAHNIQNFFDEDIATSQISDAGEPNIASALMKFVEHSLKPENVVPNLAQGTAVLFFEGIAISIDDATSGVLVDPGAGNSFLLQENIGAPSITSIDLPSFTNVADYNFRFEIGTIWSNFEVLQPGLVSLTSGVDGLEFDALSASGLPVILPSGFPFALTFAGPGIFSATLTEPIQSIPEPRTWYLCLVGLAVLGLFRASSRWNNKQENSISFGKSLN
jgi:hypothetical protein